MIKKKIKPIDSAKIKAGLSTINSNWVPRINPFPDISFFKKIKLIISENIRLIIIKYDTGFVSLLIVLVKLNNNKAIRIEAIIGRPGISQVRFNNIVIKKA
tara:strand:+ start:117 stop:419 length:303 start_codon:yes stop_codon:yes gene_type:complete